VEGSEPLGDLGAILRVYRHASGLTQQQLANLLGFDRTYISMIERGRRSITDRGTLTRIAHRLAIPPYLLGIASYDEADFSAMLAFGTSVIRLADIARHSGRAAEAVSELWPLIARLEARIAAGHVEPETMRLLARARVSFGVALGHLLPEEQLATAARKGAGLVLLARAAAESGQAELFDAVAGQCVQVMKSARGQEVLLNAFTVREVRLRGLLATGRIGQAVDLAESFTADDGPPTPQWRVIERITAADVLARAGDERAAANMLTAAVSDAEALRLPHQIQRVVRLTARPNVLTGHPIQDQALAALTRLHGQLAETASTSGIPGRSTRASA
jgi:transcriptional regulator with XRE-family HTH domain